MLAAVPHALGSEEDVSFVSGRGWRVVPAQGELDWPVLEATPERLHSAFERARSLLWTHAARFQRERRRDRRDRRRARRGLRRPDARRSGGRRRQHLLRSIKLPHSARSVCELPLRGAGGEPISFARTDSLARLRASAAGCLQESPLVYRRRLHVGERVVERRDARQRRQARRGDEPNALPRRDAAATVEAAIRADVPASTTICRRSTRGSPATTTRDGPLAAPAGSSRARPYSKTSSRRSARRTARGRRRSE